MPFWLLLVIIMMILEFIFNLDKKFKFLLNYILNYDSLDIYYQIIIILLSLFIVIFISSKIKVKFSIFQKITMKDINLNFILYYIYIILSAKIIMLPSEILKLFFLSFIN